MEIYMKRITSLLLALGIFVSAVNVFAEKKESNIFASEDFSAACYSDMQITPGENGGTGWATGFGSNEECTKIVNYYDNPKYYEYFKVTDKGMEYLRQDNKLYRRFAVPIDPAAAASYVVTYDMYISAASIAKDYDVKFYLGNKAFGGIKTEAQDGENKMYSQAMGKTDGTGEMQVQKYYTVAIMFDIVPDGESVVRTQYVPKGEPLKSTWDTEATVSITQYDKIEYIYMTAAGWGATTYYNNIMIEKYDSAAAKRFSDALLKINAETLGEQETKDVIADISVCDSARFINSVLKRVNDYGEAKSYKLYPAELKSQSIADGDVVTAQDLNSAEFEFTYALKSADVEFSENSASGAADISFDANKINVGFALKPNSTYLLKLCNMQDFAGNTLPDREIGFATDLLPYINIKDGGVYGQYSSIKWEEYDGADIKAYIQYKGEERTEIENNYQIAGKGECVVELEAAAGGKTQTRSFGITVEEAFAPAASNVGITGDAVTGAVLTGNYTYEDKNGDKEKDSVYKWFRCRDIDGEYAEIENADKAEYTLTADDENMYLKFGVLPCADSFAKNQGEKMYMSEAFVGAFEPKALNVKIEGTVKYGEKLTVKYDFKDENTADSEGESEILWYSQIGETVTQIGEGKEITVDEKFDNCDIYVTVVPVSDKEPKKGEAVKSDMVVGTQKPYADNVYVKGNTTVGQTVTGYYSYHDKNSDEEGESIKGWYQDGQKIADGDTLRLTAAHAGKTICFGVTPISVNAPFEGDTVYSEGFAVKNTSGGSSGGKGNGGGGGGYIVPNYPAKTEDTDKPDEVKPSDSENNDLKKEVFSDIGSHWAKDYIKELYAEGIVNGVGENRFEPDKKVTRAEFLAMIFRTKQGFKKEYDNTFSDVSPDAWYAEYVAMGLDSGSIAKGGLFRPGDFVTRQECAKIVSIVFSLEGTGAVPEFADREQISAWAQEYVSAAYENGVMKGNTEFCFKPSAGLTRGECAKIIWCLMKG